MEKTFAVMRASPTAVRYAHLERVCWHFFSERRQTGGPHRVVSDTLAGDPRVNIQDGHGRAMACQVMQVSAAIVILAE